MQVTKGTWRMREQYVPGSLSSSHAREPGNEAIYCGKAYSISAINNLKTMGRGHAVHERQTILSTTVVISHTFCTENELTPKAKGRGNNHV